MYLTHEEPFLCMSIYNEILKSPRNYDKQTLEETLYFTNTTNHAHQGFLQGISLPMKYFYEQYQYPIEVSFIQTISIPSIGLSFFAPVYRLGQHASGRGRVGEMSIHSQVGNYCTVVDYPENSILHMQIIPNCHSTSKHLLLLPFCFYLFQRKQR